MIHYWVIGTHVDLYIKVIKDWIKNDNLINMMKLKNDYSVKLEILSKKDLTWEATFNCDDDKKIIVYRQTTKNNLPPNVYKDATIMQFIRLLCYFGILSKENDNKYILSNSFKDFFIINKPEEDTIDQKLGNLLLENFNKKFKEYLNKMNDSFNSINQMDILLWKEGNDDYKITRSFLYHVNEFKSLKGNEFRNLLEVKKIYGFGQSNTLYFGKIFDIINKSNLEEQKNQLERYIQSIIDKICEFHKLPLEESCDISCKNNIEKIINERLKGGKNIILYGVPGAGKSWTIKHEYCNDDERLERIIFHPDYTYSDFIGQILPKIKEDSSVSYEFAPGPFTNLLKKAYLNPEKEYFLIIEEINRGNAPAIFGDIFQLLDRNKDGASEYEITNTDVANIIYGDKNQKVSIPSNMSIICTMNTSDQNVFTLDTAFQRRWQMRLIKNEFINDENEENFAKTKILDTEVTWEHFVTSINEIILSKNFGITLSEDKRLGTHFVSSEDLKYNENDEKQNSRFPEKVLKYLWDDAFKFTREDIFDLNNARMLENIIKKFVTSTKNDRLKVFKENIYNTLVEKKQ